MIYIFAKRLRERLRWFAVSGAAVIVAIIAGPVAMDFCRSQRPDASLNIEGHTIAESFDFFFVSAGETLDSRGPD
jgi:hypothetical protein